jgi:hypothetical protein
MAKHNILRCFVLISILSLAFPVLAQETAYGRITALQTGSLGGAPGPSVVPGRVEGDDTVAVDLNVPFVNSSDSGTVPTVQKLRPPSPSTSCKITTGGYVLDPKDAGVKLNESVLLSAYLAGRKVSLHLSGCVFGKPRIVSISMSASQN